LKFIDAPKVRRSIINNAPTQNDRVLAYAAIEQEPVQVGLISNR
jgi:hypothetical protein